jgi:hypothetical protein
VELRGLGRSLPHDNGEVESKEKPGDYRQHDQRTADVDCFGNHRVSDHSQDRAASETLQKDTGERGGIAHQEIPDRRRKDTGRENDRPQQEDGGRPEIRARWRGR